MSEREMKWIRVESEDDVRAGMTLRFQHEGEKTAVDVVLNAHEAEPTGDGCTSRIGFELAGFPGHVSFCIQCALRKGDVIHYLRPDAPAAADETSTPAKVRHPATVTR